jgi:polyphenol oxidase
MIFDDLRVFAAFSRCRENMSLNHGATESSLENRKVFLKQLGIDYQRLICGKQTHSANIKLVGETDAGRGALSYEDAFDDTDAFITKCRNLPLAVFTADCLSVFLYDPVKNAVGIVHAGWKGTQQEISAKTVAAMQKEFNTVPADLLVGFGPSMRQCCYEVGEDVRSQFTYGVKEISGRYFLDVAGINKKQLCDSGVKQENISDCGECTFCRGDDFFSFCREAGQSGRLISVIMLK